MWVESARVVHVFQLSSDPIEYCFPATPNTKVLNGYVNFILCQKVRN